MAIHQSIQSHVANARSVLSDRNMPGRPHGSLMLGALAWALPARTQPAIAPGLLDYAASALTTLIHDARQQAIADGVRPMPTLSNRGLMGYFPPTLLRTCRFATGSLPALTLPALSFSYGDGTAITLGDVVLFKSEPAADSDLKLWAHELTHVMQFQRWGIDGFAHRYVRDSTIIEQEATANARRFVAWQATRTDA